MSLMTELVGQMLWQVMTPRDELSGVQNRPVQEKNETTNKNSSKKAVDLDGSHYLFTLR